MPACDPLMHTEAVRDKRTFVQPASLPRSARSGIPRAIEVLLSLAGLTLAMPVMALAALAIAVTSGGPVLFRQERVGQGGRIFRLCKFRTMRPTKTGTQVTASDDDRVTWIGRILRRSKLDELPELWNVLKGEMSLVGPRPEVPCYVDLKDERWRRILLAKPGLTDTVTLRLRNEEKLLAAIKGDRQGFYLRLLQPYKLNGYVEFLETRSWRSDLAVLIATALAVLRPSWVPPPTLDELTANLARRALSSPASLSVQDRSARVAAIPSEGSDSHG